MPRCSTESWPRTGHCCTGRRAVRRNCWQRRPPDAFVHALREQGVGPISVGRVIVATWEPHERAVLQVIHTLGLELNVIFNKGAVMVLPTGVNKATGLVAALEELDLSPHNAVGVGDAENDHAFLEICEASAAVANALPALKQRADFVTVGDHGAGVAEVIGKLVADDLSELAARLGRHALVLGRNDDGKEERITPYGVNILVSGTSSTARSLMTTGLLERTAGAATSSRSPTRRGAMPRLMRPSRLATPAEHLWSRR